LLRRKRMTKLQWLKTLYMSGLVIHWGYKTYGTYSLRWIGRKILKKRGRLG